jgi:hypothetical protein
VEELELVLVCCGWRTPRAVDTVVCAPDDGWWYHPKHVQQFPDKLCNVASCLVYVRILLDDLKERRGYSHLKEESLDRTMWRARFGRDFGPVVRQITK